MISPETLPTADEAAMAKLSYLDWERSEAESLAEYVYRRRTVDLASLVPDIIEEELTASEKRAIKLFFYEKKTVSQAAEQLDINKSTFDRTLARATAKVEKSLKNVVRYQYNLRNVPFLPLAVRSAMMLDALKKYDPLSVGERLKTLRERENISAQNACGAIGIEERRLKLIESGEADPTAAEIVAFSSFFGISTDELLVRGVEIAGKNKINN